MGRAQARPPFILMLQAAGTARQPRPTESTGRQADKQTPLPCRPTQTASAPGPTPGTARPRSQAGQSSCQLTGRRVRPGVTTATTLTLAAASHWLAGPSLGHACRQYRARPRERQAHIRECLGQF